MGQDRPGSADPNTEPPDPMPVPPEKPLPMDCCESGCDRCVFDIYAEELAGYEEALAAWRERHPGSSGATGA